MTDQLKVDLDHELTENRKKNILVILFLLGVSIISFHFDTREVNLKIAHKGYGPHNYVSVKLNPEQYTRNFQNGVLTYDNSYIMRTFLWAKRFLDIEPASFVFPFMFGQTLLFVFSVAFLTWVLFKNRAVTMISIVIILLGDVPGINLARFGMEGGRSLTLPLYYGYANAFKFFALAFFLKKRYIPCFFLLGGAVLCHVTMGLTVFVFIMFYVLFKPVILKTKRFLVGISIFFIMIFPLIINIITKFNISGGGIPPERWIISTKIFSYHWYPFTMKLFTENAHLLFFPIILVLIHFFFALKNHDLGEDKHRMIIWGITASILMTGVGLLFSELSKNPTLIKLALQRSVGLVTFIGILYLVFYLYKKMAETGIIKFILAIFILFILVISKPGVAIMPLFLIVYYDLKEGFLGPVKFKSKYKKILFPVYYVAGFFIAAISLINITHSIIPNPFTRLMHDHLWKPLQLLNPIGEWDYLLLGGDYKNYLIYVIIGIFLLAIGMKLFYEIKKPVRNSTYHIILAIILLFTAGFCKYENYVKWHNQYSKEAQLYLEAQLWAKNNTSKDVLFMSEPYRENGWRDFSERSSFGNLREWGYLSILYDSKICLYREGLKRIREFGIDIERLTAQDIKNCGIHPFYIFIRREIKNYYYSLNDEKLHDFANRYGIDYFIMNRRFQKKPSSLAIAYINEYFVIYYADLAKLNDLPRGLSPFSR
jgi:hypothetical protein